MVKMYRHDRAWENQIKGNFHPLRLEDRWETKAVQNDYDIMNVISAASKNKMRLNQWIFSIQWPTFAEGGLGR